MARRFLFITFVSLHFAHLLIKAQEWNCKEGDMNIALIYDCRFNLQLQQNYFAQFLNTFPPVKWIREQHKAKAEPFSFNLFLMTYFSTEFKTFETITQETFTQPEFNQSILHINTSLCPQHLPIEMLFNETRNVFKHAQDGQRKLAIFVLDKNITGKKSDFEVSHWLESEQSLNADVKRLFIMVNTKVNIIESGLHLLTTNNFKNTADVAKRSIGLICNPCNKKSQGYSKESSCYFVHEVNKELTRKEAGDLCVKNWFNSQLVSLNTKREFQYVTSIIGEHFKNIIIRRENCLSNNLKTCKHPPLLFGRKKRGSFYNPSINNYNSIAAQYHVQTPLLAPIGLTAYKKNNSVEYTWDDGTPFVLMDDLPPYGNGKNCFMLSQSYHIETFSITLHSFQWVSYDCKTSIKTDILLCESDMSDKKTKRVNLYDLKHTSQSTYDQFLYKSFLHFLTNLNEFEEKNAVITIMKQKISYTVTQLGQKQMCDVSKERPVNDSYINNATVKPTTCDACHLNEPHLCVSYSVLCPLVKEKEVFINESQVHVSKLRAPNSNDQVCLYEINSERIRVGPSNNSHLQHCERIKCPAGFVKCPDSYCIPAYLVDDGTKDCPNGEDENFVTAETSLCQAQLKFTLKKLCMPLEFCKEKNSSKIYMNICVRQVQNNRNGYVCMSNIKTGNIGNNRTFYVSILETQIRLHEETNSFHFTPQMYSLFPLYKLVDMNLSQCKLKSLGDVIATIESSAVLNLDISRNDLSNKSNLSVLKKMMDLQKLNMSYNENLQLNSEFLFPFKLKELDVSYSKCGNGVIKGLLNLTQLKILEMRHVEPIDLGNVTGYVKLCILDVRGTEIMNIKDGYLSWLTIDTALYTDDFRLCCDVIRGTKVPAKTCHAPRDAISTCQDLIGDPLKRIILWVVGVLSLLGNLIVVMYRLLWDRAVFETAYGLFVVCLGVSDFIMGVYLLIVAGADMWYRNLYVLNDMYWRHSNMCRLAGILSTFSSETSTMFICLITFDRYLVIRYPFGQHRFSKSGKITSICLTLIIGVVVSVIPAVFPGWEIYSTNGMCLALPFSAGKHMGWEYSAILFVGLNFVLFILIAFGQIAIFRAITYKEKKFDNKRNKLRRAQNVAVARQLFLVAMSDFCCWFPIGIMGIMSLNGYHFHPEIYAWSAVLILPVNSAINPLIYTLPVIQRKMKSKHIESRMSLSESFKN